MSGNGASISKYVDFAGENVSAFFGKAGKAIKSFGPGIFLVGANIGVGSVTTMTTSGAQYGMNLLWALLLSCVFTGIMITVSSKVTLVNGETVLAAFNKHIGKWIGAYLVISIVFTEFFSCVGQFGVIGQATAALVGIDFIWATLFWCVLVFVLMFFGTYERYENWMLVIVTIFGLAFIIDAFLVAPSISEVASGLVPSIPADGGAMIAAAMVGTTLSGATFVMRSYTLKGKNWTPSDFKHEKKDAILSAGMMAVLSVAVMACAAGTFALGTKIDNAIQMAEPLAQMMPQGFALAGKWLFVIGVIGAGISTIFSIILITSWPVFDFFGKEWKADSKYFRIMILAVCAAGMYMPLFHQKPVSLIVLAQALMTPIMPVLAIGLLYITNSKKIMGKHTNKWPLNVGLGLTAVFSVYTMVLFIQSFF
ncbi:MAG: Nramp family divalent metal transporter [Candidatus Thermoplasmatota archaeon]|nr:Nramp family divalent metal transporter [Candidatus Thermoplasmatota archaeon]